MVTQNSYDVNVLGNYAVQITDIISGCTSDLVTITVGISNPPESVSVEVTGLFDESDAIEVTVLPLGSYEYQVDFGLFQSDNNFSGLSSGTHTVTVHDINNCGSITTTFLVVDYPKFFTPNGDGYNDTWNIPELAGQLETEIKTFDCYGKSIKQIFPQERVGKVILTETYFLQLIIGLFYNIQRCSKGIQGTFFVEEVRGFKSVLDTF